MTRKDGRDRATTGIFQLHDASAGDARGEGPGDATDNRQSLTGDGFQKKHEDEGTQEGDHSIETGVHAQA